MRERERERERERMGVEGEGPQNYCYNIFCEGQKQSGMDFSC